MTTMMTTTKTEVLELIETRLLDELLQASAEVLYHDGSVARKWLHQSFVQTLAARSAHRRAAWCGKSSNKSAVELPVAGRQAV